MLYAAATVSFSASRRKVRRAGVAALLADEHRHADHLVAIVLDGLDFAAPHADGQARRPRRFRWPRRCRRVPSRERRMSDAISFSSSWVCGKKRCLTSMSAAIFRCLSEAGRTPARVFVAWDRFVAWNRCQSALPGRCRGPRCVASLGCTTFFHCGAAGAPRARCASRDHSKDSAHSLANVERRDGGLGRPAGKHGEAGKLQCRHEP